MTVLNFKPKLTKVILSPGTFRYDFCVSLTRNQSKFINLKLLAMTLMKKNSGVVLPSISGMLDDFFTNDLFDWKMKNFSLTDTTLPAVNIKELDEKYLVELAAPGMKKEDLKINVEGQMLRISCDKSHENKEEDEDKKYMRREFSYQSFMRSFTLPKTVDADKIVASYRDGILSLEIPKKEEAKPKPVKVINIK